MNRIVSNNEWRVVIGILAVLWIPGFGFGVIEAIISGQMPYLITFPVGWFFGTFLIIRIFIICSRVVTINEGSLSIRTFKNDRNIPFSSIRSISGGCRRFPMMPTDSFISIEIKDDSLFGKSLKFCPKSVGYRWNKEHEIVGELKSIINNSKNEA